MDPTIARRTFRTLEPIHGMIYFTPDAVEQYAHLGVTHPRMGYFGSRVAALGEASDALTISTFYNFNPAVVRNAIPAVWSITSAAKLLAARHRAVDTSLRRAFGELVNSPHVIEAAELARRAALVASEHPHGRDLFAAHAALEWPTEPHMVLWHAQTLLREYRGDGHIAALLVENLSGIEALVSHAASGDVPAEVLRRSRGWSEIDWLGAIEDMRIDGILTDDETPTFTLQGKDQREWIEHRTDTLALLPYVALGVEGCERLRELGRPLSKAVIDAGLMTVDPARFLGES